MAETLEYIIIRFPENDRFAGEIAPELAALVDAGTIRIVDLVFIAHGPRGGYLVLEVDEHEHLSAIASLDGGVGGVITAADIEHAAENLVDGSSVLLIVWEDLWAASLAGTLVRAGGEFVEGARIPADLARQLDSVLAQSD
ncbi:DUF6325 family protein [Ilumatobacter nonamiensis]|uniref:DUF6325 family protein n=1 Tax=Ilumatobacter nonamiensis TaxID=467093 RepID=UPI0003479358|nr:DUF6325 family protein [Ilumatobacter nonamiensis]